LIDVQGSKSKVFTIGYVFGFSYFFFSLFWISRAFDCVELDQYGYPAVVLLSLYLALFPAFSCFLAKTLSNSRVTLILFFCILWSAFEYLRGILFTGFPWNLLGYSALDIKYFPQSCDIFGVYGFSFIFLTISLLLTQKKTFLYALATFFVLCTYGYMKVHNFRDMASSEDLGKFQTVYDFDLKIVQPSIPQKSKIDPYQFFNNLNAHVDLSDFAEHKDSKSTDNNSYAQRSRMIVWGEAAIPCPLNEDHNVVRYITSLMNRENDFLVTGAHRSENGSVYNSAFLIGKAPGIIDFYDKKHLLPFGEYIPSFFKFLNLAKLTDGDENFAHGQKNNLFNTKQFGKFSVLICYEIIFPGEISAGERPEWILNLTNDAWFGTLDGPLQHLYSSRMRAIEEGIAIVRCSNNGISCIIDPFGDITSRLNLNEIGTIEGRVPVCLPQTIYSKFGNSLFFLMLIASFALSLFLDRKLSSRRSKPRNWSHIQ
jgi:apolipoprotein N-acyltransferase